MILEINNLSKKYNNKNVLDDISFSIPNGEIIALIGPNGIGKTTLMKIISALTIQDSGIVKICGISVNDNREDYLSKFSSIIETPSLYENLTGYDNLKFISDLNTISDKRFEEIIQFININEMLYKKVKTYSLGMKQKLALGIALLTKPQILILDEPTNGLDASTIMDFNKILLDLVKNEKISILISSHILSYLEKIATKFLFLNNGKIKSFDKESLNNNIKTIELTLFENIESSYKALKELEMLESISLTENILTIKINPEKINCFMAKLFEMNLRYSNINIIDNNIEEIYKKIYEVQK